MNIAIASDHGGFALKEYLKQYLQDLGHTVTDCGAHSAESCDYPDFGLAAARAVSSGRCRYGVVVCTTGIGISITANKVKRVRCALCRDVLSAQLTRRHNDANMLALAGGFTGPFEAEHILDAFLSSQFEGGRHQRRVDKMMAAEEEERSGNVAE